MEVRKINTGIKAKKLDETVYDGFISTLKQIKEGNQQLREEFISEYRPFILKVTSNAVGKYIDTRNSDEFSIAMSAFNEAIDKYKPGEGLFHSFARTVIQRRLWDYYRKECRNREEILPAGIENEDRLTRQGLERSRARYQDESGQAVFKASIERFIEVLAWYNITLDDLVKASPKHRDSRGQLTETARLLAGEPGLMEYMKKNRRLPILELKEITGKSRRFLEKGRKYIIAVALIITEPEFYPLRSFAGLEKGGAAGSKESEGSS